MEAFGDGCCFSLKKQNFVFSKGVRRQKTQESIMKTSQKKQSPYAVLRRQGNRESRGTGTPCMTYKSERIQNHEKHTPPRPALTGSNGGAQQRCDGGMSVFLTRLGMSRRSQRILIEQSRQLERRELIIAFLGTLAILFSAVAFASVPIWAQWTTLGLSGLAFIFLFVPLGDGRQAQSPKKTLHLLLKFPLFWLGLLLLLLMLSHGLNTSRFVQDRDFWWRVFPKPAQSYIGWLPAGLEAPFVSSTQPGGMNAFRQMMIFAGPWLSLCALWAGIRHRRVLAGMGWAIMLAALGLAIWGVQMRLAGTNDLTSEYNVLNTSFFATFLYQNHAGAWLSLQVALAFALAFWHWSNARRSQSKLRVQGGPHWLCAVIAICLAFGSICTLSFGSMLTIGIILFLVVPVAIIWSLIRCGAGRGTITGATMAVLMIAAVVVCITNALDLSRIEDKLNKKFQLVESKKLDNREPLRRATGEMIEGRHSQYLWTGRGAGSFRWESPPFFRKVLKREERALYAHCDWLQMFVEWGLVGIALVFLGATWMILWLLRNMRYWTPVLFVFASAVLLFVSHASMDFLNYSMPLLNMLAFIVVCTAKLGLSRKLQIELEGKERKQQEVIKQFRRCHHQQQHLRHHQRNRHSLHNSSQGGYAAMRSCKQ